jgi:AraC-like DNA-binding protein/predicted transcriptional regulator YdeE
MQNYQDDISLQDLAEAAIYSPWQALRVFSEITGKTPFAYIRDIRLSEAAKKLRDSKLSVLDIALSLAFGTHEGFTKAFSRQFGLSPMQYRKELPSLPLFVYHPVKNYFKSEEEKQNMATNIVFTQVIERPARKLLIYPGKKATGYFEYCSEVDSSYAWNTVSNMNEAINYPMSVWLPESMRKPGKSEYCMAVEVSSEYTGAIPDGFDIIDLSPCKYMVFHGEPYEDAEKFVEAVQIVWDAISRYNPKHFGWDWSPEDAPRFQFPPTPEYGYAEGLPVREYKE